MSQKALAFELPTTGGREVLSIVACGVYGLVGSNVESWCDIFIHSYYNFVCFLDTVLNEMVLLIIQIAFMYKKND